MLGSKETIEADLNKHFSRYEDPLWDETSESKNRVIEIKRTTKGGDASWKIIENKKVIFILEGSSLPKKTVKFLSSVEGVRFLIEQYKNGCINMSKMKKALKSC